MLIDGDFTVSDSSVICAYLDEAYPGHPLFPTDPKDRARARWFEEYADTRLGDLFIWSLFYQKVVRPLVWGEPGDEERDPQGRSTRTSPQRSIISRASCPTEGFLFGDIGVADISIASFFRNGAYAGFEIDAGSLAAHRPLSSSARFAHLRRRTAAVRGRTARTSTSRAVARPCSMPARG